MTKNSRLSPVSIKRFFASLPDPRRRRKRISHPLINLVVMALCATIAGADTWEEIATFAQQRRRWFARFLNLAKGIPSHDTFGRVFALLDPLAFQKCLLAWVQALHEVTKGQIIAIDGKVAREAMARASEKGPLCLVSAWAIANQVVLGQVAAPVGSNELGALPTLLQLLDLNGAIVTLDALGCQKEIVSQIVEQGGDYVISVKGNQEKLEQAVHAAVLEALEADAGTRTLTKQETKHGREESRCYTAIEVPPDFPGLEKWAGLKSLLIVGREYVGKDGELHTGVRYYISSLPAKVRLLAQAVRGHWGIENCMGWVLDVAFNEDRNRARANHAQANLGVLRRMALSLIKNTEGLQGSMNSKRKQAGWNEKHLELVLFGCQIGQT